MGEEVRKPVVAKLTGPDRRTNHAPGPALRAEPATCQDRLEEIAAGYQDDKIIHSQFLASTEKCRAKMAKIEAHPHQMTASGCHRARPAHHRLEWRQRAC